MRLACGYLLACSTIAVLALGCGAAEHGRERQRISDREGDSWEQAIRPLFTRACTPCHLKAGESGLDLASVAAWKSRRVDLRRCVVVDKTMPPSGHPFSDADREIIRGWIDGND